ncbi:CheR family methyltransferase [Noviherbaspirillum massiliense]|uniref:CheR family methyltransferase n=1 Tax=Noviherbaspirillum massiliense TaxID=1465823 RepID=UPI0006854EB9|nr:CheR family methyltransferase [Noviherbaspirillum massiliense]
MEEQISSAPVPANDKSLMPSSLRFPVVGLGASAGGLQALLQFFREMPSNNGMAFVVILHLSPTHESNAASVLQAATRMPVQQVTGQVNIVPNHVYVIPPNKNLVMNDGHLQVEDASRPHSQNVAIDLFFRSLAEVHKERSVAIVLSGSGADGAVGLARVKEQGGVVLAQNPDDAEYDGMPRAAIDAGVVDFVMPAVEMPQKLLDIWANMQRLELPAADRRDMPVIEPAAPEPARQAEEALQDIITILRAHTGHDFRHYKRATVIRRIERRLQVRGLPNLPAYRDFLKEDANESKALLDDLLIGVTNFFRDRDAFDALEREVVPALFHGRHGTDQVRVWVAGCASGEEAYSVAMLLSDQANALSSPPDIQVFATDIDEGAIKSARAGLYLESIGTDVSSSRLQQYFSKEGQRYRVKKIVRDRVLFASHNLLKDPPFSKLDLITCRNLLIYLSREVQSQILEMFHFALKPGGYLFLGSSESADAVADFFTPVDKKNRIYRANVLTQATRHPLSMPMQPVARPHLFQEAPPPNRRKYSFADVHQRAVARFAPPSVIVNRDANIVHISEQAGKFLRHIGGEPSSNLISLVLPELRVELRTALYQATQHGKGVEARRVQVKRDDKAYWVNMVVRPFHDDEADADLVLVSFDEIEETMTDTAQPGGERKDVVMAQLEEELQRTKEQLQETVEHSEVSTEELKASNEELQAINEELRSATEELETSKEELQSANEELVTVNYELKMKVEETGKINDDLNNLIASTDIATVFVDRGMRIKRYTPRATDIFSIIPSDIGRPLLDISNRLEYDRLAGDVADTFASLRLVEREVHSNDGRYYIVRILPYRTTDDRIEGAVMTFIDITRRREAEEKVRAGEERMRLVAESTRDYAIITTDKQGRVTSWNQGAQRMFGFTEEEMLGKSSDVIFLPEDIAAGVPDEERRLACEQGSAAGERWQLRKDGSRLFCSGVMTQLRDGGFDGFAWIARDLTSSKQAESQREAQLSRERAEAQEESIQKDQFLAVMSHELKQPLNLININAEMLARLPEVRNSPAGMKAAGIIQRSVLSQAKIIDDLLDLSRLSTGKLALTMGEVNLSAVIESIAEVMRSDASAAGLQITVSGADSPVFVRADHVRTEQIVWNLLSNAVKFTPAGGSIAVSVSREDGMARLDVADSGQGIAPEFLPHVFDIFRQAAPATTRNKGGLGIGLALVKQLTDLHGGRVEAASEGPGKGSRFSIWLPLQEHSGSAAESAAPLQGNRLAGARVLVLDDLAEVVEALEMLLQAEGAEVLCATSAQAALGVLAGSAVDVILSDIAMPGMDGYQFIREVRRLPAYRVVPAVALTGLGREADARHALEAGFSAHMSKPVSLDALLEIVERLRVTSGAS